MKDSSDQQGNLGLAGKIIKEFSKLGSVFFWDERQGLFRQSQKAEHAFYDVRSANQADDYYLMAALDTSDRLAWLAPRRYSIASPLVAITASPTEEPAIKTLRIAKAYRQQTAPILKGQEVLR